MEAHDVRIARAYLRGVTARNVVITDDVSVNLLVAGDQAWPAIRDSAGIMIFRVNDAEVMLDDAFTFAEITGPNGSVTIRDDESPAGGRLTVVTFRVNEVDKERVVLQLSIDAASGWNATALDARRQAVTQSQLWFPGMVVDLIDALIKRHVSREAAS